MANFTSKMSAHWAVSEGLKAAREALVATRPIPSEYDDTEAHKAAQARYEAALAQLDGLSDLGAEQRRRGRPSTIIRPWDELSDSNVETEL